MHHEMHGHSDTAQNSSLKFPVMSSVASASKVPFTVPMQPNLVLGTGHNVAIQLVDGHYGNRTSVTTQLPHKHKHVHVPQDAGLVL